MKNKCYDFSKLSGKPVSYVNKDDFMNLGTFLINSNFKNTPCYTLDEGNPEHYFARLGSQVRRLGIQECCQLFQVRKLGSFQSLGNLPGQEVCQVRKLGIFLGQELRKFARLGSQEVCHVRKFSKFRKLARLGSQEVCQVKKLGSLPG